LYGNHDFGVTDTLSSVCASLTKAMVGLHCICTCDRLLNFDILYLLLYYRPFGRNLSRIFLVDPSRRQVGHPWNRLLAFTAHTHATQHNKAAYQHYMNTLLLPLHQKKFTIK